jgi:putative membrane protein
LLLGFLLPNAVMGSSLAAKKGVNLSSSSLVKTSNNESGNRKTQIQTQDISLQEPSSDIIEETSESVESNNDTKLSDAEIEKLFEYDIFTEFYAKFGMELYENDIIPIEEDIFIETLTTIDLFLDTFIGKKIQIIGFVHREDNMTDKQFVVSRFAIQCCSADAAPYGVLIEYDKANNFADDEWVKVIGTLSKTVFNDFEIMKLDVESIEKIEEPGAPYVYPNYDFGY